MCLYDQDNEAETGFEEILVAIKKKTLKSEKGWKHKVLKAAKEIRLSSKEKQFGVWLPNSDNRK